MPAPGDLIHQQSTSTGTGNITLSVVNGKRTFNDEFGTGGTNKFDYFISNQAAAEWERGTGHLSASTTLVRDTVLASSNANAAVNFSAGTKDIANDVPAALQVRGPGSATVGNIALWDSSAGNLLKDAGYAPREVLTANRTYYVRTDGSDSNTGLANTSGGAFLTIQKAIDVVGSIDLSIYDVTIQVGAGTYTQSLVFKTLVGAGSATLQGDTTTPSNVVLSPASGSCLTVDNITGLWNITGFKTNTAGGAIHLRAINARLGIGVMDYGAAPSGAIHIYGGTAGVINQLAAATTISGSSFGYHIYLEINAVFYGTSSRTTTLTGNPTFSSYAFVTTGASLRNGTETFSGSVTSGKKYEVTQNGTVTGPSGGYPGPTAGTTATGGQYV